MSITVGSEYIHEFSFSQNEVEQFAKVTGDNNPVHLDADYASTTMFKKPIMHGFLGGSIFSKVFGTLFPGVGTIYLKQSMQFLKPMFVEVQYEAYFKVTEHIAEKHRATVETIIREKESQEPTIRGEATVMNMNTL